MGYLNGVGSATTALLAMGRTKDEGRNWESRKAIAIMTNDTLTAYPLTWATMYPRTPWHERQKARFDVKFAVARDELLHELKLLGADNGLSRWAVLSAAPLS